VPKVPDPGGRGRARSAARSATCRSPSCRRRAVPPRRTRRRAVPDPHARVGCATRAPGGLEHRAVLCRGPLAALVAGGYVDRGDHVRVRHPLGDRRTGRYPGNRGQLVLVGRCPALGHWRARHRPALAAQRRAHRHGTGRAALRRCARSGSSPVPRDLFRRAAQRDRDRLGEPGDAQGAAPGLRPRPGRGALAARGALRPHAPVHERLGTVGRGVHRRASVRAGHGGFDRARGGRARPRGASTSFRRAAARPSGRSSST